MRKLKDLELPNRQSINSILNRMDYRLKTSKKTQKPLKKIPRNGCAILENAALKNQDSDQLKSLRLVH
jgi:hypothetical protein